MGKTSQWLLKLSIIGIDLFMGLAGCTHAPPLEHYANGTWRFSEIATAPAQKITLMGSDGKLVETISPQQARVVADVALRIFSHADDSPELLLATGRQPNAFAAHLDDGRAVVGINLGMLHMLGDDSAAWAALIGHEFAHLVLRHGENQQKRQASEDNHGSLLSLALAFAGVPFGGAIADATMVAVERSYSRDEEREADRVGFDYMASEGYDLEGAIRLQEKLGAAAGDSTLPFLSTHPAGAERLEAMRRLVAVRRGEVAR